MWNNVEEEVSVDKMEFISWICLYNLLSCKDIMEKYELNDFRISVLTKLQGRLHDDLVDQLPMLSHLKKWLAQISITKPTPAKPTLIMELTAQVKYTGCLRKSKIADCSIPKRQLFMGHPVLFWFWKMSLI